jgi:hypothetical protein
LRWGWRLKSLENSNKFTVAGSQEKGKRKVKTGNTIESLGTPNPIPPPLFFFITLGHKRLTEKYAEG